MCTYTRVSCYYYVYIIYIGGPRAVLNEPTPPLPLTIHALYYIPITCPACAVTHQCCSSREQLGIVTCTINYVYTADNICPGYLQLLLLLSIIFFPPSPQRRKILNVSVSDIGFGRGDHTHRRRRRRLDRHRANYVQLVIRRR